MAFRMKAECVVANFQIVQKWKNDTTLIEGVEDANNG